eukprot:jgi/Botrbrau1/11100/Bobra.0219s0009.1
MLLVIFLQQRSPVRVCITFYKKSKPRNPKRTLNFSKSITREKTTHRGINTSKSKPEDNNNPTLPFLVMLLGISYRHVVRLGYASLIITRANQEPT